MNDPLTPDVLGNPRLFEGTYLEFLGFRIIDWKKGFTRLEMPVRAEHRNTVGFLHGGVISSLLDIAGAISGSHGIADRFVSLTITLNCNFMSPHRADMVMVEGELIRSNKSLFFAEARLFDPEQNRLCATANGTYKTQERHRALPPT